jgi:hypothetical protein
MNINLPAIIYKDNLKAIYLTKNQQVSTRSKHIDKRHHFLSDLVPYKRIEIRFIRKENNSSDITTKSTPQALHNEHTNMIKQGRLRCWKEDVKTDRTVTQFQDNDNMREL